MARELSPPQNRSLNTALWLTIALVAVVYLPAIFNDFVEWDDAIFIVANPRFRPPTFETVTYYWAHSGFSTCTCRSPTHFG